MLNKNYFIYGKLQYIIILIIYIVLFFFKNDLLLIFLFIYSIFLGRVLLRNKNFLIYNTASFLLIILFLYGIFNSILEIINGPLDYSTYIATIVYASAIPTYVIGFNLGSKINISSSKRKNNSDSKKIQKKSIIFCLLVLSVLLAYKSYSYYDAGYFFNSAAFQDKERWMFFLNFGQVDFVLGFLINGLFLFILFYNKKLLNHEKYFLIVLSVYYILLSIFSGNRRDILPIILGGLWIFLEWREKKMDVKVWLFIISGIFIFNIIGILRSVGFKNDNKANLSEVQIIEQSMRANEFVYPFKTLIYEIDEYSKSKEKYKFLNGKSIFINSFKYFIPRFIYKNKPNSLADEFMIKHFGKDKKFGIAYTPVTEFFVNFGYLGPAVSFFFVGLLLSVLIKHKFFCFVFFTFTLDFCRGEIGTFIYMMIFILLPFFIVKILNNIRLNEKNY